RIANQPYGFMRPDFSAMAFTQHSYRWTPIGDMDQLRQAASSELQAFFNTYYVPNNACLILAGDLDVSKTKEWVHRYFGWIPKGADIARSNIKPEPDQTGPRARVVHKSNLPTVAIDRGYKTAPWRSDDHRALNVLGSILSGGRSGRLDKALVYGSTPQCLSV